MSKLLKRKVEDDGGDGRGGKQDELEVTGVSRSGRVRKKSSKLTDFESPDDIDNRYRRRGAGDSFGSPAPGGGRGRGRGSHASHAPPPQQRSDGGGDGFSSSDEPSGDDDSSSATSAAASSAAPSASEDEETDEPGPDRPPPHQATVAPARGQSLYMLEKSTKKKLVVRDGRVVGRAKAQRKDKGKTRFTAYMLWAKEVRQEIMRAHPDTDFATVSKRLGELWATVPNSEKYAWKRRAKRVAASKPEVGGTQPAQQQQQVESGSAGSGAGRYRAVGGSSRSKFINRSAGARQEAARQQAVEQHHHPQQQQLPVRTPAPAPAEPTVGPGLYKVVGTQPVDVAAHLKLLGESLGIIGERLKEHEGQIAVSGSLSVLLDSLLCAVGPLVCLTRQLPETDGCPPETLSRLLDNIAYFMPGL